MSVEEKDDGNETCQRCGDVDQDRRTLWMACLYEMKELGLPFDELALHVVAAESVVRTTEKKPWSSTTYDANGRRTVESGVYDHETLTANGVVSRRHFYTLRVCKECRGDWMQSIREWFLNAPRRESCGSGIFVREMGGIREVTDEEWEEMKRGRSEYE